jgi:mannosyltransferase OCH1-like enzyme
MKYNNILLIIIIIIFFLIYKNFDNNILIYTIPDKKDIVIPLNIYQTWKTNNLPPKMKECMNRLKETNPEFNHYLYDDDDCRNFIQENFNKEVLNAYDTLIPGAYKADLWRYCILYIKGGIYLDIKYFTVLPFKLISLTNKEYFVRDMKRSGGGIYNAFMVCKKGNVKLKKCIEKIVENVKNRSYDDSTLSVTGPLLLRKFFSNEEFNNLELYLSDNLNNCSYNYCIYYKKWPILSIYNEYREKTEIGTNNQPSYSTLWDERKIYKI